MPAPVASAMSSDTTERDQFEHRLDRQLERLAVDQDRAAGELAEVRRLQREKRAVERRAKVTAANAGERPPPAMFSDLPEDVDEAERVEPERVDVVGERGAAAEDEDAR